MRTLALLVALTLAFASVAAQNASPLDKAFAEFWKADDVKGAEKAAERVLKSGADFAVLYQRLEAGRPYGKERTGEFDIRYTAGAGALFDNRIEVPGDYTPDRAWKLRVQLHGGVTRAAQTRVSGGGDLEEEDARQGGRAPALAPRRENRIRGESQIYVFPSGFADAAWWHANQVDNILRVVDRLKRRYNIDERQIYLTGISDGGTGAYYMAMKDPTVWSAFLPLNGSIKVLSNPAVRAEGELYVNNLVNRPLYIVNGGRDPLYPAAHVATHVEVFNQIGVPLVFRPQAEAGHDTSWWWYERGLFEQFVKQKPRVAHPARLSWETERTDKFNRVDWLIVDRIGGSDTDASFPRVDVFERHKLSGRIDIEQAANVFTATSRGVREFTLLLSPGAIDLGRPVTVRVNGVEVFKGSVATNASTLLKWAARDGDRTRLYAAELKVRIP